MISLWLRLCKRSKLHLGIFKCYFLSLIPEYSWGGRIYLQAVSSIVKSWIDHGWHCLFSPITIALKHAPREKRNCRAETSACKKRWITTTHVCPILGFLWAWLCAKLTFILKSGFILSVGEHEATALSPTQRSKKKGNCINLIEELLRRMKASAMSLPAAFNASVLPVLLTPSCF